MKKFLLSAVALFAATIASAQSLSLVIQDHETKEDIATLNSGETYDAGSLWDGNMDRGIFFYVKNNSDKSGEFTFESYELVSGETPYEGMGVCFNGQCQIWNKPIGPYRISANSDYKNDLDFSFMGEGSLVYKANIKFSEDAEPCVFNFKVQLGKPSSINSVDSNANNVKFYQNGNNVTVDYGFNEGGNRILSIVSLSGNVVYTCELEGSNGTLNVPVELAAGVYLYTVSDEKDGASAHKFVVR